MDPHWLKLSLITYLEKKYFLKVPKKTINRIRLPNARRVFSLSSTDTAILSGNVWFSHVFTTTMELLSEWAAMADHIVPVEYNR